MVVMQTAQFPAAAATLLQLPAHAGEYLVDEPFVGLIHERELEPTVAAEGVQPAVKSYIL
jgi:hypothetical protein